MTTSISSLFQAWIFCKYYFVSSQLKHLTPKITGLGVSKMWSTIFFSKWDLPLFKDWRRCYEICPDSSFLKINNTIQMYKISATFKETLYVIYQVSLIKDDIPTKSSFNYHVYWGQTLNSNLRVCEVGKTSLQILLLYMTTFSTIFNKISIYLGLG